MGEQKVVPGLLHDPRARGQRPRPVVNVFKRRMQSFHRFNFDAIIESIHERRCASGSGQD